MSELGGLLDTARGKLRGLLGDFPEGFNAGAVAGVAGWPGDLAYGIDTARLALTGAPEQAPARDFPGTTDYIAAQAGHPIPQTMSGQIGAALGGMLTPGPGDLARLAPLGAMFLPARGAILEWAQNMADSGFTRDEIWKASGNVFGERVFQGVDGKWRIEVPDNEARLTGVPMSRHKTYRVRDVLDHPALYEKDPSFGDIKLVDPFSTQASYNEGTDTIRYSFRNFGRSSVPEVFMHELGHGGQAGIRGDFARGGAESNFSAYPDPYDIYWRQAGEVEARNIPYRMNMTWDELGENPPWKTQSVPDDQQLVRFNTGKESAAPVDLGEWFSGSKVAREDGEPMLVFRGEKGGGNSYNTRRGIPTFTDSRSLAQRYADEANDLENSGNTGDLKAAYLSIKSPLMLGDDSGVMTLQEFAAIGKKLGMSDRDINDFVSAGEWIYDGNPIWVPSASEGPPGAYIENFLVADSPLIQDAAKNAGYDGFIYRGFYMGEDLEPDGSSFDGVTALEYRPFSDAQIKLTDLARPK